MILDSKVDGELISSMWASGNLESNGNPELIEAVCDIIDGIAWCVIPLEEGMDAAIYVCSRAHENTVAPLKQHCEETGNSYAELRQGEHETEWIDHRCGNDECIGEREWSL